MIHENVNTNRMPDGSLQKGDAINVQDNDTGEWKARDNEHNSSPKIHPSEKPEFAGQSFCREDDTTRGYGAGRNNEAPLYCISTRGADGVAHLAHVGGALVGFLYLKRVWRVREFLAGLRWKLQRRRFRVMDDPEKDRDRDRWVH